METILKKSYVEGKTDQELLEMAKPLIQDLEREIKDPKNRSRFWIGDKSYDAKQLLVELTSLTSQGRELIDSYYRGIDFLKEQKALETKRRKGIFIGIIILLSISALIIVYKYFS